jgi:DNA-binding NtrC family response regulator
MESELFGYVKGAFTGATTDRTGLLEAANGGTAFFDEIGELPLELQSKLLRVLQEREFRPVGGVKSRSSNFRVIAATNRDLAKEVERGRFRQDLYFRVSVVSIRIAPLRDRRDDIPALIEHFLQQYGANHALSAQLRELMLSYAWPGNVRELENCIQRMVALNSGPLIHLGDAPSFLINSGAQMAHAGNAPETLSMQTLAALAKMAPSDPVVLPADAPQSEPAATPEFMARGVVPLVELERNAIKQALRFTRGDRVMAAHLLGIGRTTLYRKLREYNIKD